MSENRVQVKVPATIANIVCGFDILGMAVHEPFDLMTISRTDHPGISIRHTDDYGLPEAPDNNVAGVSLRSMMDAASWQGGFELEIHKGIKPGSGLGSSAASSVGAVAAANLLMGNIFTPTELLGFAKEGERLACGTGHYDNVTPCLFGGITLIHPNKKLRVTPISHPTLWCTILHPQIEIKTADARKILKKEFTMPKAIHQWANIAELIAGFFRNDYELISRALEDVIFEPTRGILIPDFNEIKEGSMQAGALGGGISGSGPAIFMLSKNQATAKKVEDKIKSIYNKIGLPYKTYVTTIKSTPLI